MGWTIPTKKDVQKAVSAEAAFLFRFILLFLHFIPNWPRAVGSFLFLHLHNTLP
jgi:hypothetical protein